MFTLKSVRFDGESKPKSDKERGRGLGRGLGEPLFGNFRNFELQIVQSDEREIVKKIDFLKKTEKHSRRTS